MKTTTNELRILYDDLTPQTGPCFKRSISTMHGDLMTSRLRALISAHGEHVLIPNSLVLDIVRNRDKLSRRLKVTQRNLKETEEYADYLEECLGEISSALVELFSSTTELCYILSEVADEETLSQITAELETTHDVLNRIEPLFENDEDNDSEDDSEE